MFTVLLGVVAAVIHITGYYLYNRNNAQSTIKPNPASWMIWTFGSVLNCISYVAMTEDWQKDMLPTACSFCCIVTMILYLLWNKMQKLEWYEYALLGIDVVFTYFWWHYGAKEANLLFQASTVLSFIPIFISVYKDEESESETPWFVWSAAYLLQCAVVCSRWDKWEDLVYPAVCFVLHLGLAIEINIVKKRS